VHAAGAVAHPGVYGVRQGARVADVLAAAGGPSAEADLDQLNLAAPVADGERVRVPRRGEVADGREPSSGAGGGTQPMAAGSAARPASAVDINRAGAQELEALPGVGPATAAAIVAWRQAHGRFRSVTDLLDVRGIGPAKFETLRPLVRV
jgi:competence protein ComEA